jgi:Uma2 family endonuclease
MATVVESKTPVGEERLLLTGISWDFYKMFCDELEGRPSVRLTYSEGILEIMVIKRPHEFYKKMLAKLVEQIFFVFNMPVASGGSMTFQREDLEKGFEHDECWWIEHEADVRGRGELEFRHDPPPDLAIEVEISRSLVDKVSIFAAIGVPEIWRFDGENLRFLTLQVNGEYQESENSRAFSFLTPQHLLPYLKMDNQVDETTRIRQFADWLGELER